MALAAAAQHAMAPVAAPPKTRVGVAAAPRPSPRLIRVADPALVARAERSSPSPTLGVLMFRFMSLALVLVACVDSAPPTADPPPPVATEQVEAAQDPAPSGAVTSDKVAKAAAIAREASAGDLDKALAQHGLTRDELEELLYEIAADPELSAAYEAARK